MKQVKTVKNASKVSLQTIPDGFDGTLSVAENNRNIPFNIKRVYYIYNLNNLKAIRGKHAHKELEQVIFCINGSFDLLLDDGIKKEIMHVNKPDEGIYMGTGVWHEMLNFSKKCILLVFSSDYYNESDYIRNYNDFIKYVKNNAVI